ncbi:MAG: DUF4339 domain-containing protein [Phycisphaerales bacterium]
MNYWIIASDGNCYGPADDATIRRWIAEGRVIAQTPVGHSKDGPWTEARAVPTLAALFPPTAPAEGSGSSTFAGAGVAGAGAGAASGASSAGFGAGAGAASAAASGGGYAGAPPTSPGVVDPSLWNTWPQGAPPATVSIPMLVSGIFNLLAALAYFATCIGAIVGIPLLLLAIFEFVTYSQGRTMDPQRYLARAKTLGILEICTILTGNVASLVCGIVILTQLGEARAQLARRA